MCIPQIMALFLAKLHQITNFRQNPTNSDKSRSARLSRLGSSQTVARTKNLKHGFSELRGFKEDRPFYSLVVHVRKSLNLPQTPIFCRICRTRFVGFVGSSQLCRNCRKSRSKYGNIISQTIFTIMQNSEVPTASVPTLINSPKPYHFHQNHWRSLGKSTFRPTSWLPASVAGCPSRDRPRRAPSPGNKNVFFWLYAFHPFSQVSE